MKSDTNKKVSGIAHIPASKQRPETSPRLVAIVGGSGSGKTWLADRLQVLLSDCAGRLSLDDFYRDRSSTPSGRRSRINYDHPRAIDWKLFGQVLKSCQKHREVRLPRYDFQNHVRMPRLDHWRPKRLTLVDGLWLLRRPAIRQYFQLRIYIKCARRTQLTRRIRRDRAERARSRETVRQEFCSRVFPMQLRYVDPQIKWADIVLDSQPTSRQLRALASRLWALAGFAASGDGQEQFYTEMNNFLKRKASL